MSKRTRSTGRATKDLDTPESSATELNQGEATLQSSLQRDGEDETDLITRELEKKLERLEKRRKLIDMERELEGIQRGISQDATKNTPSLRAESEILDHGMIQTSSNVVERIAMTPPCVDIPPPRKYWGRTAKEHREWTRKARQFFALLPHHFPEGDHKTRIAFAMSLLEGTPALMWDNVYNEERKSGICNHTWADFEQYLKDVIENPDIGGFRAGKRWCEAKQLKKQTAINFVRYLESLEPELEPFTEVQKTQRLFVGLRLEYQRMAFLCPKTPTAREELLKCCW